MQVRKRHMNPGGHFIFILHRTFVVAVVLHTRHASRQKANTKKLVGFCFYPKTHGNKYVSFSQKCHLRTVQNLSTQGDGYSGKERG